MVFVLELLGTVAFSISGAVVGIRNKLDAFGVAMLGLLTAVGGGIIRDLLIGYTPPLAFRHPVYALVAIATAIITFIPKIRKKIDLSRWGWILFDSLGLAVFSVLGVKAGIEQGNLFLQVFLGTITGVGGGILRDICAGERPMIFVRHFYAIPCLVGAMICALLFPVNATIAMITGGSVIFVLRVCAARFRWHLPKS